MQQVLGMATFDEKQPPKAHEVLQGVWLCAAWEPCRRSAGAGFPMAFPLSSPRARSSSSAAFRCQCLERTFARLDEAYPVKLVTFDFDETLTLITYLIEDGDSEEVQKQIVRTNFQTPWVKGSRIENLKSMLKALSTSNSGQRRALAVLTKNYAGQKAVHLLLHIAGLARYFDAIWALPSGGLYRCQDEWYEMPTPTVNHKADLLALVVESPSEFLPQLAQNIEEWKDFGGLKMEGIVLVDDQRANFQHRSCTTFVKVCELSRNKQKAVLFTNPLGKACYELNQERVKACLDELDRFRLLEPGLVYASEVRHAVESRPLNAKDRVGEWRSFQAEIGCQPLHLACLACGSEVERLLKEGAKDKAKVIQQLAADIVKLLVEYGARLDLADVGPMENTALHLAARAGAAHLLSTLLALGADCRAVNGDGCTAELVAQRAGQTLCQQILQVMLVEKDLDFLDGPKPGRSLRPRSLNGKGSAPATPEPATDATEGAGPRAREAKGAKYGSDGLWAMLRHPDSERSSESDAWRREADGKGETP
eukprot:s2554_g3.t1